MIFKTSGNFVYQQWIAGFGVTMLLIQTGFMGGWVSPTLAYLTSEKSSIPINLDEASWVASLVNFGRFFGAIIGSLATNYLGSKQSMSMTLLPIAMGWLVIGLAENVQYLYGARVFCGIGLGMGFSTFPLYIGEVSMANIRGALMSLATVGMPFGQVIANICGSYLTINEASQIYFIHALLLMGFFMWMPESPHHLVKNGKCKAAKKSIHWYRGGREVEEEFIAVEKFVNSESEKSFTDKLRNFQMPYMRKATFHIIALFTFMQVCGSNSIIFYMESILKSAKVTIVSPALVVVYVDALGIVASALSIFLIDNCGRRFLLLMSSIGLSTSMIVMMIHFLIMDNSFQCLPIFSMFLFIWSFYLGFISVPSTVLSETFPADIKSLAACIASLTAAITSFVSAKTYQPMVDYMGQAYVFLVYAIFAMIVIPYTIFFMRETKGKSLQQIQDEMKK